MIHPLSVVRSTPLIHFGAAAKTWLRLAAFIVAMVALPGPKPPEGFQVWKGRLVNGMTGQPLGDVKLVFPGPGQSDVKRKIVVTDPDGRFEVPIPIGGATTFQIHSPGWWLANDPILGEIVSASASDAQPDTLVSPNPASVVEIQAWPGRVITGRLLYPKREPANEQWLKVGVYINSQSWKERLGMDLAFYSWDHGDWPNWQVRVLTDPQGRFVATVPPEDARSWVRVGTTDLGFGMISVLDKAPGKNYRALSRYIPFEVEIGNLDDHVPIADPEFDAFRETFAGLVKGEEPLNVGLLILEEGVRFRGQVVDAKGRGLENVRLTTTGKHGPHAGRSAQSDADGRFEFQPMKAGLLEIHIDARMHDDNGVTISNEVRAVFTDQRLWIEESESPIEWTIEAHPDRELQFEWIDRRGPVEPGGAPSPISYYGEMAVRGEFKIDDQPTAWHSQAVLVERNGRQWIVVRVPESMEEVELVLPSDSVVKASYQDETGSVAGPGSIRIRDLGKPTRRKIFGDPPDQK